VQVKTEILPRIFNIQMKPWVIVSAKLSDNAKFAFVLEVGWHIANLSHNISNTFL